jgi:autotransporter-associated beta strand protein
MKGKTQNLEHFKKSCAVRTVPRVFLMALCLVVAREGSAQSTIIKANTATMNAATDWVPNTVPANSTIGEFDSTIAAPNAAALALGGNVTLASLVFTNNLNGPVTISGANALTLDSSWITNGGIDMSTANQSVTFNAPLTVVGAQAWKVAAGQTLTIGGALNIAGASVDFSGFAGTLGTFTGDGSGILGPWATTGSGTLLNYAAVNGGVVSAYTAGTALPTSNGSTTANYILSVAQTQTGATLGNTLQYTGTGATTLGLPASDSLTLEGLLDSGTGNFTVGASTLNTAPPASIITVGTSQALAISVNAQATNTLLASIQDNSAGPSSVTYNGPGTLVLGASGAQAWDNSSTFSGNFTINGGTVSVLKSVNDASLGQPGIPVSSPLGNRLVSRSVIVNDGAILSFDGTAGNELGRGQGITGSGYYPILTTVVNKGGVLRATISNRTIGPLVLNGGTVIVTEAIQAAYQALGLSAGVTVGGNTPSFIITTTNGGINLIATNLANYQATFNVADVTGDAGVDLTVSAILGNYVGATTAAGLIKAGAGTMLLTATNYYSGPTTISAGTLIAGTNSPSGALGALGAATTALSLGDTNTAINNSSAALLIGGPFTIGRTISVSTNPTTGMYVIGGSANTNSTFGGLITMNQPLTISQAATTGTNALTISGGITNIGVGDTLTLAGPGNVNVTKGITDGGSGLVVNINGGTDIFSGLNNYGGGTTVANAALIVNGSLNGNLTGNSGSVLGGSGTISGNVTVSGKTSLAGSAVTNTIGGNVTYNSGSEADFFLGNNAALGGSSEMVLNGGGTTLSIGSGVSVGIACGTNLDISGHNYVLFNLTGGGSISGSFNPTPLWLASTPNFAADYTVVNTGTQIVLQYNGPAGPSISAAAATPNPALRGQAVTLSVTAAQGAAPIIGVTVDTSSLGGSSTFGLVSDNAGDYTNTLVVAGSITVGNKSLAVTVTDGNSFTANAQIPLTIVGAQEVWNGAAADNNWSSAANWNTGIAPSPGDNLTFDGTTRLSPLMNNSYTVGSLVFDSTAGSFDITGASGDALTLLNGMTNNSASAEIVNVPMILGMSATISALSGNLTLGQNITNAGNALAINDGGFATVLSGGIFGAGSLNKNGTGTSTIAGASGLSGATTVNAGTLILAGANNSSNVTAVANAAILQLANANAVTGTLALHSGSWLQLRGDNNTVFTNSAIALDNAADTNNFDVNSLTAATGKTLTLADNLAFLNNGLQTISITGNGSYTLALGNISTTTTALGTVFDIDTMSGSASLTINSFTCGNYGNFVNLAGGGGVTIVGKVANTSNGGLSLYVNDGTTLTLEGPATVGSNAGQQADAFNYLVQNGTLVVDHSGALTNNTTAATPWNKMSNFILGPSSYSATNSIGINTDNSFNCAIYLGDTNFPNGGITVGPTVTNVVSDGGFDILTFGSFVNSGIFTIGGQNTSGTNTFANPIILGSSTPLIGGFYGGKSVTVVAAAGGEVDFTGGLLQNGSDTTAAVTVGDAQHAGRVKFAAVTDTYPGGTTVAYGKLVVNNTIGTGSSTVSVNSGAELGGAGTILDPVTIQAGGNLKPGQGGNDTSVLTVDNSLTLQGTATLVLNRTNVSTSSQVAGLTMLNIGGTLTVTNMGNALQTGDTFTLFNAAGYAGTFSATNLPALVPGLSWSNNIVGNAFIIAVTGQPLAPPTPPTIGNVSFAGGSITFSGTNGVAGQPYRILTTTNLATPMAAWIPITTNVFAPNGDYTNSLPLGAGQGFFRLVTP